MTQCEKEYCQEREQGKKILDQARFQHEVLAEIHELTGAESKHPLTDRDLVRVKAQVALRAASKSGLLT
jgi:hypothetical protein